MEYLSNPIVAFLCTIVVAFIVSKVLKLSAKIVKTVICLGIAYMIVCYFMG